MRKLIYSMTVSVDGFIAGPGGNIDWSAPDEELHQFHNDQVRELGVHLLGRRLYETMLYWETADQDPAQPAVMLDFARIWQPLPKIVFSSTLERVEGNATLATRDVVDEVTRLKEEPGGDLAVGGAGLAAELIERNLIDDYRLFVAPVILGAGTPYFPGREQRIGLELLETRTFNGGRVVYLHYARA
jgi:dihydrofolate reductase